MSSQPFMEQEAPSDSQGDRSNGRATPINIMIDEQPAQEAELRPPSQHESATADQVVDVRETEGSQAQSKQRQEASEAQNSRHQEDSKADGSQMQPSSATYARQSEWTVGARDYQRSGSGFARQYESAKQQRQSVSPHLQTEYERTQRVLEQARARSREQIFMNPGTANGYEKRDGSPQRYSPNRDAADVSRVSYRPSMYSHVPQTASYAPPVAPRRSSHSPVPDQQQSTVPQSVNFRQSTIRKQEELYRTVNEASRSASRDASPRPLFTSKENVNPTSTTTIQPSAPQTQQKSLNPSQSQASRVIEHSQTVVTNAAAIKSGEGIFDQIIATYRRQLATNGNFESDFDALRLKIQEVMQRRNMLEDSIRHLSQDYERQLEMQEKESSILKKELEALRVQNADLASEGNHTNSDIMDAKTILNQKETELARTKHDLARQQEEGHFLRDTIEETKRQLTSAYATKDMQHAKIFQLTNTVKQQESSNFAATSSQAQKTTQLQGSHEQIRRLQDTLHHKSIQNEDAAGKYELARAEHARCMGETQALQKDCENANQRNGFLLETQRQLSKQKEAESGRGSNLHSEQAQKESTFVQLDNELQSLSKELDAVRRSNESLLEAGHCYKQELHALQNHADILALQNNDLQKELDEFVLTDDIIKTGLNRKTRVQAMKDRNVFQTSQSLANVEKSRSPARSASRSPLRPMTNNYSSNGAAGPSNSLTQAYMSHNRMTQQQQEGVHFNFQNHASTLKEMCRKQLQENLRQQDQRQCASTSSQQHLARSASRKEQSQSPVDYRASNGSPLRKSKDQI